MTNYTFLLPQEQYRWLCSEDIFPNRGEVNEKGLVTLPPQFNKDLQNGIVIAKIIRLMLAKAGETVPDNLNNLKSDNAKTSKQSNWNFIWLAFDELRMQFDVRIKDLIIGGESALITQILKQLYDRDENKDEKAMKNILINQMVLKGGDIKNKTMPKSNTLDIKKINPQRDPNESESSLQFLILLLNASFNMPTQEILGLFTNQNKYLAHLIVKGLNDDFTGVVLFYSLLMKYNKKLKQFCEKDRKDAQSCLYAIKPGMISKNAKVAELTIHIFSEMKNIYEWFVSDSGKCSTTLFLGIKRHPHLITLYWDLLLHIIENEEVQFFTNYFKKCFRDAEEMVQICTYLTAQISTSFLKDKLMDLGILAQWMEIGINLFANDNLQQKLLSYKFIGEVMKMLPEIIQDNEDYLINLRRGWKQKKFIEYVHLIDQIMLILEELAGEKNAMARKIYQIIIEIFDSVHQIDDKRQYLVRNLIEVLPKFPKIPTQFLIQTYKEGTLKPYDFQLIKLSIEISNDNNNLARVGETLLKLFLSNAVLNHFMGNFLFKISKKIFVQQPGKFLVAKIIKDGLNQFAQIEINKKIPQVAKNQPMYLVHKGNYNYNKDEDDQFTISEKSNKNILALIEKLTDLTFAHNIDFLERMIKQELMETNALIKKNHYKSANKALSSILAKRFAVSREEEEQFNEDYKIKKSMASMDQSMARKKMASSANAIPMTSSRYGGPEHLRKEFDQVIEKRRKEEEQKKLQSQKKVKQQALKKLLLKKQYEKANLLRGFGQQAELKQDGFWSKFNRDDKQQVQIYPTELMQPRDLQYIDNLFKKYHRVLRMLFFKYTSSMYKVNNVTSFEDNKQRNQTLCLVQLIKFLKDFKFFFLTNKDQVQNLVRELNVKLLNKRQTQDLDFNGFQQFIIQFCSLIYTKTHTINASTSKGIEMIKKNFGHLSHLQLVQQWFNYLRLVFIEKGQKTSIFDEPEAAYFNETEVIIEFTKQIEQDPTFILPEGYKKISEKVLRLVPNFSDKISTLKQSYKDVFQVLDEILYQSQLQMHLLEPLIVRQTKIRVKPHAFVNVKAKLLEAGETKMRALSSIMDKKPLMPPVKMLEKKTLTLGMKKGLAYVSYKDKLLGQQVAYIIDDMLNAVENGKSTIEKEKIVNQFLKKKQELTEKQKFAEIEREKKRLERKNELQKLKKQITEKKQKQADEHKDENEKKKQTKLSKQKKLKDDKEKYLEEQKNKLKQKKKQQEEEEKKKKEDEVKGKEDKKKQEQKFKQFNQKQIEKFKKQFGEETEKKKKELIKQEEQKKKKQELVGKLRSKIHESDKKAIEMKIKINQQISQLYNSQKIKDIYKEFQPSIRSLFDFLLKSSYYSLTEKKNNSQIIAETWHYFNMTFQLIPLITNAKQIIKIFKFFTKDKQTHKDYQIGLTFDEFQQCLLRIAIKHKSIFNKLSQKIKDDMTAKQIDAVVQKDIEQKQKNEFEQPKQIDVKSLMKEEDIKKQATDHYGDISKVNEKTLKGLIYYLKIPKDKQGQQRRYRQILSSKISYATSKTEMLKQKLNDEYSLAPPPVKKKKKTQGNNQSQILKNSEEIKQDQKE